MNEAAPIILAALMDKGSQAHFTALRTRHFPPERNYLAAHITMFHHLPGTRADDLVADVKDELRHHGPITARTVKVHMMGRGVSYVVESEGLRDLRARLAARWAADLVPQDRAGWRPHITVQNKVKPDAAKALHAELGAGFAPREIGIEGVTLWWYRGGPWERLRDVRFRR
ncbi:MAG: 2'-5' RNA ligase family protein [Pacificimonas sp.]|jgi:hypothetical protein|nr:2'-5' RNA ligase family protein [Pacificimonas sp.]